MNLNAKFNIASKLEIVPLEPERFQFLNTSNGAFEQNGPCWEGCREIVYDQGKAGLDVHQSDTPRSSLQLINPFVAMPYITGITLF